MTSRQPSTILYARRCTVWGLFAVAWGLGWGLAWGLTWTLALGAPDDFEVDPRAKAAKGNPNFRGNFVITLEQMESWVFNSAGQNRQGWTRNCEKGMKARLAEIEATEPFSEQQRSALKLAMQGDIERVLAQFDKLLEKHPPSADAVDQEQYQAIYQDLQPLRLRVSKGIFRKDSLFAKAFRQIATESQWNRLQELEKERRKKRWLLAVQLLVVQLDQACPMRHEQRQALTKVLSERNPPVIDGEGNSLYIAYSALASTPAEKWKKIFDDRQLPRLEKHMERYQGVQMAEEADE